VLAAENTEAIPNHTECDEGTFWSIPDAVFIPGVDRLNGRTDTQGKVSRNQRSGQPTGRRGSQTREIQMRRNYGLQARRGWDINAYVEQVTTIMKAELMESRSTAIADLTPPGQGQTHDEEAVHPEPNDPDTPTSDAEPVPGGSTPANPALVEQTAQETAPMDVDETAASTATAPQTSTSPIMDSVMQLLNTPTVGDSVCACGRWRNVTQDICECGGSVFNPLCPMSNTDHLERSGPPPSSRVLLYAEPPPVSSVLRIEPPIVSHEVRQEAAATSVRQRQEAESRAFLASQSQRERGRRGEDAKRRDRALTCDYGSCRTSHDPS
jgi:hypothetical protein